MARKRVEQRSYIPTFVKERVLSSCNGICAHCGTSLKIGVNFTLEHVIPLNKGGKNDESNYVALCEDCNKAKSDDVVEPREYYKYLPKSRVKELQEIFENYCKSTDWLGYDNLFKTDQFTLVSAIPVFKRTGIVNVPTSYRVEKARRSDVFNYLTLYKGRLRYEDKDLIVYNEEELTTPYYRITRGDTLIMYISPYINKTNWSNEDGSSDIRNTVYLDIYVNPDLQSKRSTIPMLYNIVQIILNKIQDTLRGDNNRHDSICCVLRTPSSDVMGLNTLKELNKITPDMYRLHYVYEGPNETGGCIAQILVLLFTGYKEDLNFVAKQQGLKSGNELLGIRSIDAQSSIDMRLMHAKEIVSSEEVIKTKKKDKKASKKKKHR